MINPFKIEKDNKHLRAQVAELTKEIETLKSQDSTKEIMDTKATIESLTKESMDKDAKVKELTESNASLTSEIEKLKLELANKDKELAAVEKSTTDKAIDIVAAQGIPVVPVMPEDRTQEEIVAEFKSIKNPIAARQFYIKHYNLLKDIKE